MPSRSRPKRRSGGTGKKRPTVRKAVKAREERSATHYSLDTYEEWIRNQVKKRLESRGRA